MCFNNIVSRYNKNYRENIIAAHKKSKEVNYYRLYDYWVNKWIF